MKRKEDEEKKELIEEIREFSIQNPVLVEGKKDKEALHRAGIESNAYSKGIEEFAEMIRNKNPNAKRLLILTDYDERGELLRKKLKESFSRLGMEENIRLRRKFRRITRLVHVEGLK